ncbi:MAG: AAA family ATPase [Lachnospiraceae bacterium]|nr:AAA family ATPase [Lachnospiraceae bacterium]
METSERIFKLEAEIATLPQGSINIKKINGKEQPYLQWTENGKSKSKYIKKDEREQIFEGVKRRKQLQEELRELKKMEMINKPKSTGFETSVITGERLLAMAKGVQNWQERDCFSQLQKYLKSEMSDRVCLIFGLRRTGKTTMLRQAVLKMTPSQAVKTAYIKANGTDSMAAINRDLEKLQQQSFETVFIDEVTLMPDFIDSAALFSDIYAVQGMKIVLSGTDSLGFWFALHQELYDRAITIHTTFIPFREHSRLLGINSIDEYIRYGGTLRAGEIDFEDDDVNEEDASFRDDESTRRYIDTAICKNIQHSLSCCRDGGYFRHLQGLYEADELTGAINRIIEDMNHRFLIRILISKFKSHDLGSAAEVLRKDRNPEKRSDILDRIDTETVTKRLVDMLEIRNKEEQSIGIMNVHVEEIKEYLKALDLIVDVPRETIIPSAAPLENILFTQPGMRYCQAQALVHCLTKDELFAALSEQEKIMVAERISEEVRGRMMEDIVLLETAKSAKKNKRVFKLQFAVGEYDMVIYDSRLNSCECYEVKHSDQIVSAQTRYLTDEERLNQTSRRFGKISKRCVLYRGKDVMLENGIEYRNVEEYLRSL